MSEGVGSNVGLRRQVKKFIELRAEMAVSAWPRMGRDVTLVEEDGVPGSLLYACHTDDSMTNPMGMVHGGIKAALVDTCMGVTCSAQYERVATPTITMTVNYARPVPLNADIRVRVHTIRVGVTSGQMSAEVFLPEKPEELLVTATAAYSIKRPRS